MALPNHISYSFLHLLACPYASWLRYEAALRGETTPWLALGNAVHYAIEHGHETFEFNLTKALKLFKTEYNRIIVEDDVFIGYPQLKKLEAEGLEMVERYYAQIQSGAISPAPLALEKEFSIPIAGTTLVGRIDKVEWDSIEDEYDITDFKSGKSKPDPWFLRHNPQFTAYAWACLDLYGKLPRKMFWHHLRTGELIETTRTMDDINDLKIMIENAVSMKNQGIKHRIFHEQVCGYCDYAGAICDDREMEKRLLEGVRNVD